RERPWRSRQVELLEEEEPAERHHDHAAGPADGQCVGGAAMQYSLGRGGHREVDDGDVDESRPELGRKALDSARTRAM
ncbi:MAG TPA: hypothetical protein VLQ67_09305, partial [Arachnia sp.]|nr:hypothetical protein [Arachnia sp.]